MSNEPSFFDRFKTWQRTSIGLKIFTIAFLVLILLIPIAMVSDLIRDRKYKQQEAFSEVSDTWGRTQTLKALVLTVPYLTYTTVKGKDDEPDEIVEHKHYAHFLPDELVIDGVLNPEKRHRGIYDVVVYNTEIEVKGNFSKPNFNKLNIPLENVQWQEAYLELGLSDLRSIQNDVSVNWLGSKVEFDPGVKNTHVISSGISTAVKAEDSIENYDFSIALDFNGSSSIYFTPLGKTTQVNLTSNWPDPKFKGAFLPDSRTVTETGFEASWEVLHLNRNYPQEFVGTMKTNESNFGVELLKMVDHYKKCSRSVTYAVLFIALTFLVYFFTQIRNKVKVHPIQYLMVGLTVCLFFTLLLALSEHIGFDLAYLAAAVGTIGLITTFSHFIFKDSKLTMILCGILIVLYGFIYIILQMAEYSLLIGSIGLFFILAFVMWISRNIDWYSISKDDLEIES